MKNILLLASIAFFITSCGNQAPASPSGDTSMPVANNEPTLKEKQDKAAFVVDTNEDSMEIPHSKISVDYNESRTFLAEIPGIAEINPAGAYWECPEDALASCGCWYAGGGDYYYVTRSEKGITLFHGWQDEMQEDAGYHWEEFKTIE